jgi:hypothetical protein
MLRGRRPEPMQARAGARCKTPLLDALWLMEGLLPRSKWAQTLLRRIRQVYKPDWTLDSSHDFLGRSEWLGHIAIGWQGVSAVASSLVTGKGLAQSFLCGANYNPSTVRQSREELIRIDQGHAMPAHHLRTRVASARL